MDLKKLSCVVGLGGTGLTLLGGDRTVSCDDAWLLLAGAMLEEPGAATLVLLRSGMEDATFDVTTEDEIEFELESGL